MLITIGRFKRCYLYARYIGSRAVKRVMKGGEQIWPGEHDRIRRLVFEEPDATTEDYAYWKHVGAGLDDGLDVRLGETKREIVGYEDEMTVGRKSYLAYYQDKGYVIIARASIAVRIGKPIYKDVYYPQENCRYASVSIDGRLWYVKRDLVVNYDATNALATLDKRNVLDFGDDGPYRGAVKVGDMVGFDVDMPARSMELPRMDRLGTRETPIELPGVAGSELRTYGDKGAKKTNLGYDANVYAMPSNVSVAHTGQYVRGHKRGGWSRSCGFGWTAGSTSLKFVIANREGPSWVYPSVYFPAFKRTIKLKVVDIVYND